MLGYLLLYKWACAGKRVVAAQAGFTYAPILFCEDGAFILSSEQLMDELDNPDVM
jgi:sulfur relay (sulfurtransferase) DsrF/TusC family protein